MARWRLTSEILARSVADTWNAARLEWELERIFFADPDEPWTCLCGHQPILKLCVIANRENGNEAVVGSCCVKRFLGLPSGPLFAALERVAADPDTALSAAAVKHAHGKGWISDREKTFYLDTLRPAVRCRLSERQRAWGRAINERVLAFVKEASRA
jgi:hypothetical protein